MAWVAVSALGGFLAYTLVSNIAGTHALMRVFGTTEWWFVGCGVFGAMAGLYCARHWIGVTGRYALVKAFCGIVIVSFMGALIGGSLMLPLYGTMFGPMLFAMMLVENPVLALVWIVVLIAAHILISRHRREREQMFAPVPITL
ncbi:hypothetical protein [Loktanella sp. SALINAS62]|uniref:hypothetical protein n=1 Tax=Loktanella sp. SALINAS62 TaxID=2706124 RepID=UPI001B8DA041|nr:hypothetical protein [Loktanella sp. SALINAS62]MBS1303796.1 hypothetical protein [Loktanella sp. SALINAS62]